MTLNFDRHRITNRPGIKWARHGSDVLALWVADMDFEVPEVVLDAVRSRIDTGGLGYDFYDQPIPVLEVFVNHMEQAFGWKTSTDQLVRVHDVIQGLHLTIDAITDIGDGIICQTPAYHPFFPLINGLGRRIIDNPMRQVDDGWQVDLEHVEALAARDDVTALLLCNPHNPTGIVFGRDQLLALAEIAERHDLVIISDEIHCDLVYEPRRHTPIASVSDTAANRTVTVTAATKSFNVAGLRMAFIHSASERYLPQIKAIPSFAIGGIGVLGQVATIAGWTDGDAWLTDVREALDHNRHLLGDLLSTHLPGTRYAPPQATYLAWVDLSDVGDGVLGDDPAERLLSEAGVYVNSGRDFFPPAGDPATGDSTADTSSDSRARGNGCIRMNFATDPQLLTEAVTRMGSLLGKSSS